LKALDGHVFEDTIAEILASLRFGEIGVRVRTIAGEVDIIGFSRDVLGTKIGYVFELKQRAKSNRPISVSEVTRLYGIREGLREKLAISRGVFATTTTFTRNAREFGEIHQLSLSDFGALKSWIDRYEFKESGFYLTS
jgi:restriction endonuclease